MPFLRLALFGSTTLLMACGLNLSDETTVTDTDVETGDDGMDDSCESDDDCTERAEVCGPTGRCIPDQVNLSTTCDESQSGTFSGQPLPLFRGELCTVKGRTLKTGQIIPVTVRSCHHSCVTPIADADGFEAQWDCDDGICDALLLSYVVADGDACPPEAWEEVAKEDCVWSEYVSMGVGPVTFGGTPIEAEFNLEVPHLTNADTQAIVDYASLSLGDQESQASEDCEFQCNADSGDAKSRCLENCLVKELAYQYPQQETRLLPFDLRHNQSDPPETCGEGDPNCECYTIGF